MIPGYPRPYRAFLRAAALVVALLTPVRAFALGSEDLEAAFVYNFVKLVTWPAGHLPADASAMQVCLLADAPAVSFSKALAGKLAGEHPLEVRRVEIDRADGCHVVFLDTAQEPRYPDLMARLSRPGLLLVDEGRAFTWPNGMIRLFVDDGRMRFEINLQALERAGFTVDPRMIRLAVIAAP